MEKPPPLRPLRGRQKYTFDPPPDREGGRIMVCEPSRAGWGKKEASLKRNLIPPPFTGEVSAKLTEGGAAIITLARDWLFY
jgi:hypothetical protein